MALDFIKEFIKDRNVAAISPSSSRLIKRLLRHLRPERIKTIVELGPGPAVATRPILNALGRNARYIAIERNAKFAALVRRIADPRLEVVEGDARKLREILAARDLTSVDAVIASIPFTYLKKHERTALIAAAHEALAPGGDLIVFHQYSPLMVSTMAKMFGKVKVEFEALNLFPCFLLHAKKSGRALKPSAK
jgi:phospholipid N-methyltransferase